MKTFLVPVKAQTKNTIDVSYWDGTPEGVRVCTLPVRAKTYRAAEITVYKHNPPPAIEDCYIWGSEPTED